MLPGIIHSLPSNLWTVLLIAVFFGGSIFVHELGHFVVARRRGLRVERFSIGFGPAIVSWHGRDGVEYRISWFPLGGYVLLPQLADLAFIEGRAASDGTKLPSVSYGSKMLVFVAGAACNILFAFALACIISVVGQLTPSNYATTTVGYVTPTLDLTGQTQAPSPALLAGLRPGDRILTADGSPVKDWLDLSNDIVLGSGRDASGQPLVTLGIDRAGRILTVPVHPVVAGPDGIRQIGILADWKPVVSGVESGSVLDRAGLKVNDQIVGIAGSAITGEGIFEYLKTTDRPSVTLRVLRGQQPLAITISKHPGASFPDLGISLEPDLTMTHPSPFTQVWSQVVMTCRTLESLVNRHSDIGLSKLSGVVGIVHLYSEAAQNGLRTVMIITILINVNLAILNLLPVPVLDGGQMLFATIGWIRGRSLPVNFVATTQGIFLVLILMVFGYVSFFDVGRWRSDITADRAAAAAPAGPTAPVAKP